MQLLQTAELLFLEIMDMFFFRFQAIDAFGVAPAFTRSIEYGFSLLKGRVFFPA